MPLSSASTLDQVKAAYDDNADYDILASVPKAQEFIRACRLLIRRLARRGSHAGESLETNIEQIQEELAKAETWLSVTTVTTTDPDNASRVTFMDFAEYR